MIVYGWRLYGAIDRVPGLLYVVTQFLHVSWFPVFPVKTFIVIENPEDPARPGAVQISLSLRSAGLAYGKALLVAAGLALLFFGSIGASRTEDQPAYWGFPALGAGLLLFWWWQRKPRLASPDRAMELARLAGIPLDTAALAVTQRALRVE